METITGQGTNCMSQTLVELQWALKIKIFQPLFATPP